VSIPGWLISELSGIVFALTQLAGLLASRDHGS
jgi:hypothetical protein